MPVHPTQTRGFISRTAVEVGTQAPWMQGGGVGHQYSIQDETKHTGLVDSLSSKGSSLEAFVKIRSRFTQLQNWSQANKDLDVL